MWTALGVAFIGLGALVWDFASDGASVVTWDFITSMPSRIIPERAGIESAIVGTLYLMVICAVLVVPLGIATAVYLEEYADQNRWYNRLIEVNIQNLRRRSRRWSTASSASRSSSAGRSASDRCSWPAALTLALLVLPVVIIVAREAIRAVPPSIREGSLALGATQWQSIWKQVLPGSVAGIIDRRDPGPVASHRRDGAAARHRRRGVAALQPRMGSTARSRPCRSRSSRGPRTESAVHCTGGRRGSASSWSSCCVMNSVAICFATDTSRSGRGTRYA